MKIIMILLTGLTLSISAFSQSAIKGKIQDSTARTGLSGATIQVRNTSFSRTTVSALAGEFSITEIPNGSYKLTVTFVGFDNYEKTITVQGNDIDLGNIELGKSGKTLTEVVIKATTPPTQQKGDTVQFNANQFKVNPDANVEDLVKKMPGIQIENGEVKTLKLIDFKSKIRSGEISKDIEVFDFSKNTYLEFLGNFLLPFERSWAASIK